MVIYKGEKGFIQRLILTQKHKKRRNWSIIICVEKSEKRSKMQDDMIMNVVNAGERLLRLRSIPNVMLHLHTLSHLQTFIISEIWLIIILDSLLLVLFPKVWMSSSFD